MIEQLKAMIPQATTSQLKDFYHALNHNAVTDIPDEQHRQTAIEMVATELVERGVLARCDGGFNPYRSQ